MPDDNIKARSLRVPFYGGVVGALVPFVLFITGVVAIALSGAPDERGFWPILILSLTAGLLLSKDKTSFCNSVIEGMSQQIVMIMITAWLLASIIGVLMSITGFVEALSWLAGLYHLNNIAYIFVAFFICCVVSVATGTSFGTILICGPILFPAGGLLGSHAPTLAGAIIGGATFGDCIAPISDTTIASALSQEADIGTTVKTRLKYVIPAAIIAVVLYFISASMGTNDLQTGPPAHTGNPKGLVMLLVPVVIIFLLLRKKHLLHGLLFGLFIGVILGLLSGLLPVSQLLSLDVTNFTATSFVIDGINRAVGISFFTILLMGLVSTLKASGFLQILVAFSEKRSRSAKHAEIWISGAAAGTVLLTCHSIVAILTVGEFAKHTGENHGISRYRRANLLSLVVCTFPFILPYFIPVILTANTTLTGSDYGITSVSPLQVGLYNFMSWALLGMVLLALFAGLGHRSDQINCVKTFNNTNSEEEAKNAGPN